MSWDGRCWGTDDVVANMRSWKHSGFSVDQSVRLEAGDPEGVQRLIQYFLRCPFSQARMIRLRPGRATAGQVEKILRHCGLWEDQAARAPPSPAVAVEDGG